MEHIKLDEKLVKRVNRYFESLWKKFKGINDSEILEDIPETIKNDILINMLKEYYFFSKKNFFLIFYT